MTVIPSDGVWSLAERNQYFIACQPGHIKLFVEQCAADLARDPQSPPIWVLMAMNDLAIDSVSEMDVIEQALDLGIRLLIDSGVFWLTNRHKRAHGLTMDQALSLAPDEIDGFDWLLDRYVRVHDRFADRMWGIIELDQGGADRKRETRAHLRSLGINPIPVYHPMLDGWEYFDELASTNDRICFGNVVQASAPMRHRLLMTAYERKRAYPHLWIHLLGYSLNETLHAAPVESCDSSSWNAGARWGRQGDKAMLAAVGQLERGFTYNRGDLEGLEKATNLGCVIARLADMSWRDHLDRLEEVMGHDEFR